MKPLLAAGLFGVIVSLFDAGSPPVSATGEIRIVGQDYAFNLPRELPAGATTFRFYNNGKKGHEFNIFLLKPGATINQVLELQKADKSTKDVIEGPVGVLFAEPGNRSAGAVSTDLLSGREYGIICIFRDSANAPRHYEMGMYSVIHVRPSRPASAPTGARADTIVGMDYAFRYPKTLTAGRHTFVFRNEGKVRHEFNMSLLKQGVTLDSVIAVDKAKGDVDALLDDAQGVLWARAGQMPFGRLEVDLLPDREYMIDCGFSDDDKSPPHYTLGMYGSIRVRGKPKGS